MNAHEGSEDERKIEALQRIAEELVFLNESIIKYFGEK